MSGASTNDLSGPRRATRLLNLGCGHTLHPSWVNADLHPTGPGVLAVDLRGRLPFPDASFDVVYHSHTLEHLPRDVARRALEEQRRVLRPGGILRVVVPDLEQLARNYLRALEGATSGDPKWLNRYDWTILELLDQCVRDRSGGQMFEYIGARSGDREFVRERIGDEALRSVEAAAASAPEVAARRGLRSGLTRAIRAVVPRRVRQAREELRFLRSGERHLWMYDRHSLPRLLADIGFRNPRAVGATESEIPEWAVYALDTTPEGVVRKPDSLFVEARR